MKQWRAVGLIAAIVLTASTLSSVTAASASTDFNTDYATYQTFPLDAYQTFPYYPIGRLFGTFNGSGFSCSAAIIGAPNQETIVTAGHCLYSTSLHVFAANVMFIPQYHNGGAPLGGWNERVLGVPTVFESGHSDDDDIGFASFFPNSHGTLQGAAGALGGVFNNSRNWLYHMSGYPGQGGYSGQYMMNCDSIYGGDIELGGNDQPGIKLPCDWTQGGASGSPVVSKWTGTFVGGPCFYDCIDAVLESVPQLGGNTFFATYLGNAALNDYQAIENT